MSRNTANKPLGLDLIGKPKKVYEDIPDSQFRDELEAWAIAQVESFKAGKAARAAIAGTIATTRKELDAAWRDVVLPILQAGGMSDGAIRVRKSRLASALGLSKVGNGPRAKPTPDGIKKTIQAWIDRGMTVKEIESIVLSLGK
jgi:hypothetical protein